MAGMANLLSIGDFSRMTFLSVKTLRHYHDVGLLEPAEIDPYSGYRRYSTDQLPQAQVILRLRGFGMPLDEIGDVLGATDLADRNATIISHLERMERQLEDTRATVASLRHILSTDAERIQMPAIQHRHLEPTWTGAVSTESNMAEVKQWLAAARRRLDRAATDAGLRPGGPDGTLFFTDFFTEAGFRELGDIDRAEVFSYLPVASEQDAQLLAEAGAPDIRPYRLPAVDVAVVIHHGAAHTNLDRTFARLGSYVTGRDIGVAGPIREHHLDPIDSAGETTRTEVAWPILPVSP